MTPNNASMKYSGLVNLSAIDVNGGAINASASTPINVPIIDAVLVTEIANLALPRSANGCPSNAVAAADAVPGMFSRIADMEPP